MKTFANFRVVAAYLLVACFVLVWSCKKKDVDPTTGIKNLQTAFVMKSKTGDDNNTSLIKVGLGRTFKDDDGLAEKVSSFRIGVQEGQATGRSKGQVDN